MESKDLFVKSIAESLKILVDLKLERKAMIAELGNLYTIYAHAKRDYNSNPADGEKRKRLFDAQIAYELHRARCGL